MERTVKSFHRQIVKLAVEKLGRPLTTSEHEFIVSRRGFVALEMILDTVKAGDKSSVEKYLNHER